MSFEFLYLCYSDSRTGLMAIFASSFIFVLCKTFENKPKKYFINVITSIIIPIILVGSVLGVKSATSQIKMMVARNEMINAGVSEEIINAIEEANRIGRYDEEINQGDKSNNRFAIWDNAVDIYLANPIVGISFRNIMEYARAEMPEGFISTSGFESMHNSFVDVMVSQGTIGLMLLFILVAFSIIAFLKSFNGYLEYKYLIAIIAAIFASMMFYSETFYMNTGSAFLFWIVLGYMINYRNTNTEVKL
ncbi:MAG: O-antigen ligase family protein [Oscillospiraceae bacterium]|nr:O-antigen ligase family protein [Oscillospiraceae bacterium]